MTNTKKYGHAVIHLDTEGRWYIEVSDDAAAIYCENTLVERETVDDFYHGLTRSEQDELLMKLVNAARAEYRDVPAQDTWPPSFDWWPSKDEPTSER